MTEVHSSGSYQNELTMLMYYIIESLNNTFDGIFKSNKYSNHSLNCFFTTNHSSSPTMPVTKMNLLKPTLIWQKSFYTVFVTCRSGKMSSAIKQSLVVILIVSDYPPTSAINIFSNNQIYYPHHLSFSATLCLSHSLFLSLRCSALSPQLLILYLTLSCNYHLDHSIREY
jgi:hypothetical protein